MFEGMDSDGEGPAQVAPRRRGADSPARPERVPHRGHGVGDQLQHGVDVDLRAAADVHVPRALRSRGRAGGPPQPRLSHRRLRRRCRRAEDGSRRDALEAGRRVTVHCNYVDMEAHDGHDDSMMDPGQRIWGFETNFGSFAEISMVKANQLMPKPTHLTWEEAACLGLVSSTSYRMLVSPNGAQDEAGRRRPDLGRDRRSRWLRMPVRAERRRHPGRRRLVAGEGRAPARRSASSTSSTARPRATSSGTATSRTRRSSRDSARRSASSSARTPTSCSSTRAGRRSAPASSS